MYIYMFVIYLIYVATTCYRLIADCVAGDLGDRVDTTRDSSCLSSSGGSVQIVNGTVCYNGLNISSEANYSCSCGFSVLGNERRVCQRDGIWSGTTPQCVTDCKACVLYM